MRRISATLAIVALMTSSLSSLAVADPASLTRPVPQAVHGMPGQVTVSQRATDTSHSGAHCYDYEFPVTIQPHIHTVYRVWARLCSNTSFQPNRTVQLLLHGGTYDHNYWDWPYNPDKYSYVKSATEAGFITLNMDRLGYGYSDHPQLSQEIDFNSNAWVAHQIIQYLRKGALGEPFQKVIENGHSLGSATTMVESGTYRDVDGTMISGGTHTTNFGGVLSTQRWYPACIDPKFKGTLSCLSGYIADMPGQRCNTYYYKPDVDPKVCALDEKLKSTFTASEFLTFPVTFSNPYPANRINSPVLVALGEHDKFFCELPNPLDPRCDSPISNAKLEKHYYPNAKSYELYIEPRSGHMNNLHYGSTEWFAKANQWATEHVGVLS